MIDHLVEVIFKDVPENKIGELLKNLTSQGDKIANYTVTCDVSKIEWDSEQSIETMFKQRKNFGLFLNLKELRQAEVLFPKCGISIYKYEDTIDLEINFKSSDLAVGLKKITRKLMSLAEYIAIKYNIKCYYCGIESAEEKTTRLFTNRHIGPLVIEDNRE